MCHHLTSPTKIHILLTYSACLYALLWGEACGECEAEEEEHPDEVLGDVAHEVYIAEDDP